MGWVIGPWDLTLTLGVWVDCGRGDLYQLLHFSLSLMSCSIYIFIIGSSSVFHIIYFHWNLSDKILGCIFFLLQTGFLLQYVRIKVFLLVFCCPGCCPGCCTGRCSGRCPRRCSGRCPVYDLYPWPHCFFPPGSELSPGGRAAVPGLHHLHRAR